MCIITTPKFCRHHMGGYTKVLSPNPERLIGCDPQDGLSENELIKFTHGVQSRLSSI